MKKSRFKKKAHTVRSGVGPTQERRKKNFGVFSEIVDRDATGRILIQRWRACAECILDACRLKRILSETEHEAGMKFRQAYLLAVYQKYANEQLGSNDNTSYTTRSQRLLEKAYSVLLPQQKRLVVAVCGHDEFGGGDYELDVLRQGLDKLIELWRLA